MSYLDHISDDALQAIKDRNRTREDYYLTQVERAISAIPAHDMTQRVAREIVASLAAAMIRSPYSHMMDESINQLLNAEGDLYGDEQ